MSERPDIRSISTGAELRRWYWRKDELMAHARRLNLRSHAGKFAILDRIAHFLDTGEKSFPSEAGVEPTSNFDWRNASLSASTVITDNYRNTQNVRQFFQANLGSRFSFNIALMDWMKSNAGRTLGDACEAYRAIQAEQNGPGFKTQIKSHNQFNQYTRDFLEDNQNSSMTDVRRIWALKIQRPSADGRHVYERADLALASERTE